DQARILHLWPGQGYDTGHVQAPGAEQARDRDHVLIADRPDGLGGADWIEVMDVCTCQTCRVRAGEFFALGLTSRREIKSDTGRSTNKHLAWGQMAEQFNTKFEISGGFANDHCRVGRQRVGVDGCDKDGVWLAINGGYPTERAGPKCRPEAGRYQGINHQQAT